MTFSHRPELRVSFTRDFADIQSALLFAALKGTTALIDAVYLAMRRLKSAHNSRKALLVISDGGDNNSRYSKGELRRYAKEADVQIYGIGIHEDPKTLEEASGPEPLEELADAIGGQHFMVRSASSKGTAYPPGLRANRVLRASRMKFAHELRPQPFSASKEQQRVPRRVNRPHELQSRQNRGG